MTARSGYSRNLLTVSSQPASVNISLPQAGRGLASGSQAIHQQLKLVSNSTDEKRVSRSSSSICRGRKAERALAVTANSESPRSTSNSLAAGRRRPALFPAKYRVWLTR